MGRDQGGRENQGAGVPAAQGGLTGARARRGEIYAALRDLRDRYAQQVRDRYPHIPRRVSGYNLDELLHEPGMHVARALTGSEGTCVVVLRARLRLVPQPAVRRTVVLGFSDGPAAADAVPAVMKHEPIGLEGFDGVLMDDVRALGLHREGWDLLPPGRGWLLAEFGGDTAEEAGAAAGRLAAAFHHARALSDEESPHVWGIRESGLGATARVPGQRPAWPGWEDSAVDPGGHFGQGCVHTRIDFDLASATGIAAFRSFMTVAAKLCARSGGSRLGPRYRLRQLGTRFAFTEDGGDFAQAVSRCVGVGACRTHGGTVMCPSYQATREEEHSTRGRAHLLFELLTGEELADGWRDRHVKDALDLCMSCKGCKGCKHDCPVGVDMARYKAEFLSHWYSGRFRPAPAYSMGLLMHGARLASAAPGLANAVTHAPGISTLAKRLAGVHPDRGAPRFAAATFRHRCSARNSPTCCLAITEPHGSPPRPTPWPSTSTSTGRTGRHHRSPARYWRTATAMTVRCSASPPSSDCCSAPARRRKSLRQAAAAWPERSGSSALLYIKSDLHAGTFAQQAIVSALLLGEVLGEALSGYLADAISRK